MLRGLALLFAPERVAGAGWILCVLFTGYHLGATGGRLARADPVYFCTYSSDCARQNTVAKRCCSDVPPLEASWTAHHVCRPACVD